ncbi:hypothetical protein VTN77DRAFT_1351 [Rasamsonia byssochlamydoides]|uniref:uncharacterized protein n=1 Tax=Rasamsonia byssochlamydoides TaxID=89139 RepID=UPI0037426565
MEEELLAVLRRRGEKKEVRERRVEERRGEERKVIENKNWNYAAKNAALLVTFSLGNDNPPMQDSWRSQCPDRKIQRRDDSPSPRRSSLIHGIHHSVFPLVDP